jgi:hypothetical protein
VVFWPALAAGQVIGTVVSAHGNWCDGSKQPCAMLWKMYPVQQDSKLVRVPPVDGKETVTIRSRWGVKETFDCSTPRELGCNNPLDLSRLILQEPQKNVVTAFLGAVLELAADHPSVYETFRQGTLQVRGSDAKVLSDGVAKLTKDGLNLNNILSRLDRGDYLLELCLLNGSEEAECPAQSAPVDYVWNVEKPVPYRAGNVHAGLYRLYRWNSSSVTPRRTREYAEVLVAEETNYQALSDKFGQVVEATHNWDADDNTAPALRRAYLYTLSPQ